MRRATALLIIVALLGTTITAAQENVPDAESPDQDAPVPYSPDEFPRWTRDLRRGEIVTVGAFPVAMIVAGLLYQVGRFSYQSAQAGSAAMDYAPWFLSTSNEPRYDEQERRALVASGVGISIGVALVDFVIGRRREFRIPD